jgi:hypothetical protein
VFITAVPIIKAVRVRGGESGGTREEPCTVTQGVALFSLDDDDDDDVFYLFLQKQKSAQSYIPQGYFPP